MLSCNFELNRKLSAFILVALLCMGTGLNAQDDADIIICIDTVTSGKPYGGFLGFNRKVDFTVTWKLMKDNQELRRGDFEYFKVLCSPSDGFDRDLDSVVLPGYATEAVFKDKKYGKEYDFKVAGLDPDGQEKLVSNSFTVALPSKDGEQANGRGLSSFFEYSWKAFQNASIMGKAAFIIILLFLAVGLFTWFVRTRTVLRGVTLFPKRDQLNLFIKELEGAIDPAAKSIDLEGSGLHTILSERATVEVYRSRAKFVPVVARALDSLVHFFRSKPPPVERLPTFRIARVGIGAVNKEKDIREVLESRAGAELEHLRRRSFIDLLWAIGVTAPLLGLFGTVTGLSYAFSTIIGTAPKDLAILQDLSKGIFEALFTTIWGLIAGILCMLSYYYYNYKLDRVYSCWQMFASDFVDRFIYQLPIISSDQAKDRELSQASKRAKG